MNQLLAHLHRQQEAVHTNEREEKNIVWTKVIIKGMRIPTGKKKMSQYEMMQKG
jgi:hypothetical protein